MDELTQQEWQAVIITMRKAPHPNLDSAEVCAALIEKVAAHANSLFKDEDNGEDVDGY